jgi:hypothetical protein
MKQCEDLKQACIDFCVAKAARVANFPGFVELCRTGIYCYSHILMLLLLLSLMYSLLIGL